MTEQQTTILIALTRNNYPRTARDIGIETGYPAASVRRSLIELRKVGFPISLADYYGEYRLGAKHCG